MKCESCTKRPDAVPYMVHESAMARQERTNHRAHVLNVILSVLFFAVLAVAVILAYRLDEVNKEIIKTEREKIELEKEIIELEREFETVETVETQYEIDQEANDGGRNYIVGGDFNGEAESQDYEENNDDQTP